MSLNCSVGYCLLVSSIRFVMILVLTCSHGGDSGIASIFNLRFIGIFHKFMISSALFDSVFFVDVIFVHTLFSTSGSLKIIFAMG